MFPELFGLRTYSFLYVGSMLAQAVIAWQLCRRHGIARWNAGLLALCYALGMVGGAKILFDIVHLSVDVRSYFNVATYLKGGLWGGLLAYLLSAIALFAIGRQDWRRRLDLIAWTLPIPLILAKLACLANGCCYGLETSLPWAVCFPPGAVAPAGVWRHPTQIYEMSVICGAWATYCLVSRRGAPSGALLAWFVLIYGVGRPLTELFRADLAERPQFGAVSASQVVCALAAAAAVIILWRLHQPKRGSWPARVALYAPLLLVAVLYLTPLLWMVCVSLKGPQEVFKPTFLPQSLTDFEHGPRVDWSAYTAVARSDQFDFPLYARNTLIITLLSLVGVLLSCSIAAYGFARVKFPGRDVLFGICLATMMIPFPVIMVPSYMLFKYLGWIGTFLPLWVPSCFGVAFNIFLLRQFFMGIPNELEESARIDGCSTWGCFWRICLPLSKPALAVVALFHCLAVWNDLVGPLIFLTHQEHFTLALGLQFLQSKSGDTPWNQLMAASTLIVVPVLVLFLLAQKTFIRGIATTGIKG
ncbi:MAG: prolipoprotein diacylglyceryl transferase family protein [Phycisphaerae bacterium]